MKALASQLLSLSNAVILDTETSGLAAWDEVIEIAIIDMSGRPLLNTFVYPTVREIHPGAFSVHGIPLRQCRQGPTIMELDLLGLLQNKVIAAYNAPFDRRLLCQSAQARGMNRLHDFLRQPNWPNLSQPVVSECAYWIDLMSPYARYWGEKQKTTFRGQSLVNACKQQGINIDSAHSALGDALLTLELIKRVAQADELVPTQGSLGLWGRP